ncbi:photosynthetic NDH subunit of lumenal location 1, chloroplastic [Morus notabilis]|uniref:photosynthetic NDH subunit of lumenal location 1, chloroplastic n=1 Tax=Morus notabilis TaxID=981085 RepID=UPI000CED4840|nr:photosynthetic NDH subunit of lumenal location 1, chloroplastic [Morus notabilis]
MAVSSLSLSWVSTTIYSKLNLPHYNDLSRAAISPLHSCNRITCSGEKASNGEGHCRRITLLLGVGALTGNLLRASSLFAEEIPENYRSFVDTEDGYSYYYPADWRDFDFRAHDSAFKDRYLQLQNVRVRFIPTDKKDIHDLGPMEEVVPDLVKYKLAAPNQVVTIFDMQEKNIDGKNYYTVEFQLTSPNFAVTSFATVAIANGRYYTQIVVANERRWRRVRNKLKVVADSFRVLDI